MQPGTEQREIKLTASTGDYQVSGFSEDYVAYLNGRDRGAEYSGWFVMAIGIIIALVGFGTLVLGPETITYNRLAGPTLLQYIQMYPGPIFSVGGVLFAIGTRLHASSEVSHEAFLLSRYKFIAPDGTYVNDQVELSYLGGDNFSITTQ
ncbi:hypothetical protein [Pseudomonas fulva]|uniref:hypothetical protein n=1 Tax=Pseudomonas fulva TaxID=47880 RepID=UPI003462E31D